MLPLGARHLPIPNVRKLVVSPVTPTFPGVFAGVGQRAISAHWFEVGPSVSGRRSNSLAKQGLEERQGASLAHVAPMRDRGNDKRALGLGFLLAHRVPPTHLSRSDTRTHKLASLYFEGGSDSIGENRADVFPLYPRMAPLLVVPRSGTPPPSSAFAMGRIVSKPPHAQIGRSRRAVSSRPKARRASWSSETGPSMRGNSTTASSMALRSAHVDDAFHTAALCCRAYARHSHRRGE